MGADSLFSHPESEMCWWRLCMGTGTRLLPHVFPGGFSLFNTRAAVSRGPETTRWVGVWFQ